MSPPKPNIGRNAQAQSIGTVKRIEPPHSEMNKAVSRITEGMEINTVVVWKNVETDEPMPVKYMWCAHTMKLRNPSTSTPYTIERYPHSGLRVLLAMISATIEIPGRRST